ncbi:hypothetical protein ACROYT_G015242 [Oculina patagonica]
MVLLPSKGYQISSEPFSEQNSLSAEQGVKKARRKQYTCNWKLEE